MVTKGPDVPPKCFQNVKNILGVIGKILSDGSQKSAFATVVDLLSFVGKCGFGSLAGQNARDTNSNGSDSSTTKPSDGAAAISVDTDTTGVKRLAEEITSNVRTKSCDDQDKIATEDGYENAGRDESQIYATPPPRTRSSENLASHEKHGDSENISAGDIPIITSDSDVPEAASKRQKPALASEASTQPPPPKAAGKAKAKGKASASSASCLVNKSKNNFTPRMSPSPRGRRSKG